MNRWVGVHRPAVLFLIVLVGCSASPDATPSDPVAATPTAAEATSTAAEATAEPSPSGPPTSALEDRMTAEIEIGGADFPIDAFGSVWVVAQDQPEPAIVRIDPATNEVVASIAVVGRACQGIAAGFGSIWACTDDGIARIDPETNSVISVLDLPAVGSARLAASNDAVWAFTNSSLPTAPPDALLRIDPRTERTETTQLGHVAGQMSFAFGSLWVTSPPDGLLLRVDPDSGEVTTAAEGLETPFAITPALDSLWLTLHGDRDATPEDGATTVVRLDPATLEVQGEIAAGPMSVTGEVAVDETGAWVRNSTTFLARYDTQTYEPLEIVESSQGGGGVLLADDSVWATSYDFNAVWRLDP